MPVGAPRSRSNLVSLYTLVLLTIPVLAAADPVQAVVERYATQATIAVTAQDLGTGEVLTAINATKPLKPASVLKLLTSLAALERFGPSHTFTTTFSLLHAGRRAPDLVVRGQGAPDLTIEKLWMAVREIRARGTRTVHDILLDDSAFMDARAPSGDRAYETGSSALSFNFNSVKFSICPSKKGGAAAVSVEPPEIDAVLQGSIVSKAGDPTWSIEHEPSRGTFGWRLAGTIPPNAGCISTYRSVKAPAEYLGRTLQKLLTREGIAVLGTWMQGSAEGGEEAYVIQSRPLLDVVIDLNHFSNNFVAEQLLFALGRGERGFSRTKGLAALEAVLSRLGIRDSDFTLEDASGLSHANRITATGMLKVIRAASEDPRFGPEFLASLPRGGESGTLKRRIFDSEILVRGKTGSLNGVSSLAGVMIRDSRRIAFVIFVNGSIGRDRAMVIEQEIVNSLAQKVQ